MNNNNSKPQNAMGMPQIVQSNMMSMSNVQNISQIGQAADQSS